MSRKTLLQEIRDQVLHFLYGLLATVAISVFLPLYVVFPVVLLLALVREKRQHPSRKLIELFNVDIWVILFGQAIASALLLIFFN